MKSNGFTTLELLIAVGVVGVITTLASGAYYYYIPKGQATEAVVLVKNAQMVALGNIKQATCAVGDDSKDIFIGKYGQAQIGGAFKVSTGSSCPSGCTIEYKFNPSGVAGDLKGKVLALDLLNDGRVSKNISKTTLDEKYLPRDLVNITSSDSCAVSAPTVAVKTEGLISGTEVGDADPTPPPPPPPSSTPDPSTPDPRTPGGSGSTGQPPVAPPPPPVVSNAGKFYGYAYRWNQSYMGGYMPMLEIGCVYHTDDPLVVRYALPAYGFPANFDSNGLAVVTSPNFKYEANKRCEIFKNNMGSKFSSLPLIHVSALGSDRRFTTFIKF